MKRFSIFLVMLSLGITSHFAFAQTAMQTDVPAPQTDTTTTQTTTTTTQTDTTPAPTDTTTTPTATTTTTAPTDTSETTMTTSQTTTTNSIDDTKMAMRKLWEDHIVWTRNVIISTIAGLQDLKAVTNRLLQNQDDIGNAIKPYYGDDAGNQLAKLLREHILIADKVVRAAKAKNNTALDKAQKEWSKNADDIATFLSDANPNWSKTDLLTALQMHLDLTTKEASSRLHKDWKADIQAYDDNQDHMLMFSDMLVDGIAKQFPDKF